MRTQSGLGRMGGEGENNAIYQFPEKRGNQYQPGMGNKNGKNKEYELGGGKNKSRGREKNKW